MKAIFKDRLQLAGLLVFGYLIVLAVVFFKERMIAYDSANYVFEIDQLRDYCLPHGRWSSVLSQTIPLLLLKAGCSLKTFLIAYSVNLVAIWYVVFLLVTIGFRNRNAGIILIFSMTVGFGWMYYYAISELLTGMTMSILLYAALEWHPAVETSGVRILRYFTASCAVILASFYHELALFPILFVIGFRIVRRLPRVNRADIALGTIILLWCIVRVKYLTLGHSIGNKILSAEDYLDHVSQLFSLPSWSYFVVYISDMSRWIGFTALVAALILTFKRKWFITLYAIMFSFAYGALVAITYYKGESSLMMETYMPPVAIYAVMLLLETETYGVRRSFLKVFIGIAVVISCIKIYSGSEVQSRRLDYMDRITAYMQEFEESKIIVKPAGIYDEILLVPWALPMESLLNSSLNGNAKPITITFHNNPDSVLQEQLNDIFLKGDCQPSWIYPDQNNLHLGHTNYRLVNTSQNDSSFNPAHFNCTNIDLIPCDNEIVNIPYHKHGYVNVRIRNSSGFVLRSIPDGPDTIVAGYRIYNLNGQEVPCSSYKTQLEVDVYTDFIQCVRVESPSDAGDYILIIDLYNNGRWLNSNAVMRLHVPGKSPLRFLGF